MKLLILLISLIFTFPCVASMATPHPITLNHQGQLCINVGDNMKREIVGDSQLHREVKRSSKYGNNDMYLLHTQRRLSDIECNTDFANTSQATVRNNNS